MTGVNFAAGKAFVISSTSGFVYVYDMSSLRPAGRIKIGTNIQLETATTDTQDQKLYLADSTENAVVIIDARTQPFEKITENVGLVPVGHAHHGQQGQLLSLSFKSRGLRRLRGFICESAYSAASYTSARMSNSCCRLITFLLLLLTVSALNAQGVRERIRQDTTDPARSDTGLATIQRLQARALTKTRQATSR